MNQSIMALKRKEIKLKTLKENMDIIYNWEHVNEFKDDQGKQNINMIYIYINL